MREIKRRGFPLAAKSHYPKQCLSLTGKESWFSIDWVKYALLFLLMISSVPSDVLGELTPVQEYYCQIGGTDGHSATTNSAANLPVWHSSTRTSARRNDFHIFPAITPFINILTPGHLFGLPLQAFVKAMAQAAPLYQTLQVYRI
jgi:hypothetical protein